MVLDELPVPLGKSVHGTQVKRLALAAEQESGFGFAQARRRLHERVEHRLQIKSRAADDLEHIGGCGLLLQRFLQLARPLLHFLEQPRVLDRDHCLISERLHEAYLSAGEWPYFASGAADDAYWVSLLNYRNRHERSVLERPLEHLAGTQIVIEFSQYVLELQRLAVNESPPHDEVAGGRSRKKTVKGCPFLRRKIVEGDEVQKSMFEPRDRTEVCLT